VARILVVDDDEQMLDMITMVLSAKGHVVAVATDGHHAIQYHRAEPVELIVTDMVMPEMDGLEVARELRRISPDVPLIAMSGSGFSEVYLEAAKMLGARNILPKPFPLVQLVALVEEVLADTRAAADGESRSAAS
jgi:DNA-binding response OmpR family regulator